MGKPVPELIAVISDLHCGSTVGLCGPKGPMTDDGQVIQPSRLQQWLLERFEAYWQRVKAEKKRTRARLTVVCNGDAVDGPNHHGTTQSMSSSKDAQAYIAHSLFEIVADAKPEQVYFVRGTTSHVGEAGGDEEALAASLGHGGVVTLGGETHDFRSLPVVRDPISNLWSYQSLLLERNGVRIDCRHHASVGNLPWTAPGAIARLAFRIWTEHAQRGWRHPDLAIRSHLHHYRDSYGAHPTRAIITPAWQAKSNYAHQVVPETISDFGGLIITIPPAGAYHVEPVLFPPDEPTPLRS